MSIFEVFAPGDRHWREQKERQQVLVHDATQGQAGPDPLDLESGHVTIAVPQPAASDRDDRE